MPTTPPTSVDRGLTDPLDGLLGERVPGLLALVDRRAGIRVDALGVELRTPLRTRRVRWDEVERLVLDSRLDGGLDLLLRYVPMAVTPLRRVPLVGAAVARSTRGVVREAASAATSRLVPGLRSRAGMVLATFELRGGDDVAVDGTPALLALLDASVTAVALHHATARGIEVVRR